MTSQCDYILASDSRSFSNCQIREPALYASNHFLAGPGFPPRRPTQGAPWLLARSDYLSFVTPTGDSNNLPRGSPLQTDDGIQDRRPASPAYPIPLDFRLYLEMVRPVDRAPAPSTRRLCDPTDLAAAL